MGNKRKTGVPASMTAEEYRQALEQLGLTQVGFATIIGASGRSGQKWALDEARVPGSVAILLRLLLARPELKSVVEGMGLGRVVRQRGKADA